MTYALTLFGKSLPVLVYNNALNWNWARQLSLLWEHVKPEAICKASQYSDFIWSTVRFPFVNPTERSKWAMVLFIRKLILQMRVHSHPVGLDVWFLVSPFVYFHTSCVWTAKGLASLRRCAGSPEPLLVAYVISTILNLMSWLIHSWSWPYTSTLWKPLTREK